MQTICQFELGLSSPNVNGSLGLFLSIPATFVQILSLWWVRKDRVCSCEFGVNICKKRRKLLERCLISETMTLQWFSFRYDLIFLMRRTEKRFAKIYFDNSTSLFDVTGTSVSGCSQKKRFRIFKYPVFPLMMILQYFYHLILRFSSFHSFERFYSLGLKERQVCCIENRLKTSSGCIERRVIADDNDAVLISLIVRCS